MRLAAEVQACRHAVADGLQPDEITEARL